MVSRTTQTERLVLAMESGSSSSGWGGVGVAPLDSLPFIRRSLRTAASESDYFLPGLGDLRWIGDGHGASAASPNRSWESAQSDRLSTYVELGSLARCGQWACLLEVPSAESASAECGICMGAVHPSGLLPCHRCGAASCVVCHLRVLHTSSGGERFDRDRMPACSFCRAPYLLPQIVQLAAAHKRHRAQLPFRLHVLHQRLRLAHYDTPRDLDDMRTSLINDSDDEADAASYNFEDADDAEDETAIHRPRSEILMSPTEPHHSVSAFLLTTSEALEEEDADAMREMRIGLTRRIRDLDIAAEAHQAAAFVAESLQLDTAELIRRIAD